ncbi:MAG: hypothetical protein OEY99_06540 [Aigarchaeota archaeon]|nr:hypothetical protein [Aigarchaeota archaeon]
MESEKVRSLIKTTVLYSILIGGLLYLQFYQEITIPIPLEYQTIYFDPTFLLLPLISLLTFSYASNVIKSVIIGKLGPPLSSGINRLGLASFFWLLTLEPVSPPYLLPFGNFVLIVAFALFARSVISTILMEKNQIVVETMTTSAAILLIGIFTSNFFQQINVLLEEYHVFSLDSLLGRTGEEILLGLFYQGLVDVLDESILMSSIFISAISLTGIFRSHPNPYLDYLGKRLGKGLAGKFVAVFLLLVYVLFLREFILLQAGLDPQLVTVAEWGVICIVSYGMYRKTRGFVSESLTVAEEVGYWTRHIQEIEHKSDIRLDNLAGLVERFIRSGERDGLIVYIADVFRRFNLTVASISTSLSALINHRDIEIGLTTFSWQKRMLERMNLESRHEALSTVLEKLRDLALQMTYRAEATPKPFYGQQTTKQEAIGNEN